MHLLADIPSVPSLLEAPLLSDSVDMRGVRHFCKSMSRVQEILCWAAVENLVATNAAVARAPLGTDSGALISAVKEFAANLARCSNTREAIAQGHLDCQRVSAFVQLMGLLSEPEIAAALQTAYRRGISSRNAPFSSFASFLLNVCDAVEGPRRTIVFESVAVG